MVGGRSGDEVGHVGCQLTEVQVQLVYGQPSVQSAVDQDAIQLAQYSRMFAPGKVATRLSVNPNRYEVCGTEPL